MEYFQSPPESIAESVQHIAENQPEAQNISPLIGQVSPPAPRNPLLIDIDTPTLVQSMTALEAEKQHSDIDEWDMQTVPKLQNVSYFINHLIFSYDNQQIYRYYLFNRVLVLICKYCYYLYFENCILQFSFSM